MANQTTILSLGNNAFSPASSSASTSLSCPQVFINHRGPDVKNTFASHLYRRLLDRELSVFLDREEMEEGHNISSQIEQAIRNASVHIAILSPTYADSSWCLNELVLMKNSRATILPIFFNVDPSVVRHTVKDGEYAEALRNLQKKRTFDPLTGKDEPRYGLDTIQSWRTALSYVADLSGFELKSFNGDEGELLDKVLQRVLNIFSKPPLLSVAKYPTGLEPKLEEFEKIVLQEQEEQVKPKGVGIGGVGGVGKTTVAKEFFNLKRSNYNESSILFEVREKSLNYLQSKLIKDFKLLNIETGCSEEAIGILEHDPLSCHALIWEKQEQEQGNREGSRSRETGRGTGAGAGAGEPERRSRSRSRRTGRSGSGERRSRSRRTGRSGSGERRSRSRSRSGERRSRSRGTGRGIGAGAGAGEPGAGAASRRSGRSRSRGSGERRSRSTGKSTVGVCRSRSRGTGRGTGAGARAGEPGAGAASRGSGRSRSRGSGERTDRSGSGEGKRKSKSRRTGRSRSGERRSRSRGTGRGTGAGAGEPGAGAASRRSGRSRSKGSGECRSTRTCKSRGVEHRSRSKIRSKSRGVEPRSRSKSRGVERRSRSRGTGRGTGAGAGKPGAGKSRGVERRSRSKGTGRSRSKGSGERRSTRTGKSKGVERRSRSRGTRRGTGVGAGKPGAGKSRGVERRSRSRVTGRGT